MKKILLIVSVISLIAGSLSLLISAYSRFGYYNVMDGSADLYANLYQRMIVFFIIGIILAVVGIFCLFIRSKK